MVAKKIQQCEVYWVILDPTIGSEIKKIRPCLIISPNDMNAALPRVLIAPITSKGQDLGCRPKVKVAGKKAKILLDQIRSIDKVRLQAKITTIPKSIWHHILLTMLK